METLKINFGFFWKGFDKNDNYFTRLLSRRFKVVISENPDFYLFTHSYYNGQRDYLKYNCHRIFFGWENIRADWNICDYVLDSDFCTNNLRHKRYPMWVTYGLDQLCQPKSVAEFASKKNFCCMVVSNESAKERIEFFHKLSQYKKVDSGGRFLNNIGYSVDNKMEFIKDYKFVISFENSSHPGYTTEKLIEPMFANSIPVYWGNTEVATDFNTKSFVNINDFKSYDEAIKYIIELDKDDDKYLAMASQPWLNGNKVSDEFTVESFLDFFNFIVKDSKIKKPVATSIYHKNIHRCLFLKERIMARIHF